MHARNNQNIGGGPFAEDKRPDSLASTPKASGRKCYLTRDVSIYQYHPWTWPPLCASADGPDLITNLIAERVAHLPRHAYRVHERVIFRKRKADELIRFIDSAEMSAVSNRRRNMFRSIDQRGIKR